MKNGKRAVVLSGGGTKGAYEIGVWRALRELSVDYQIVTCSSIVSINGAMMAMGAYEKAYQVWNHMVMEDLMQNPRREKGFFRSAAEAFLQTNKIRRKKLIDGAVDIRILSVVHGKCLLSARRSFFAVQC